MATSPTLQYTVSPSGAGSVTWSASPALSTWSIRWTITPATGYSNYSGTFSIGAHTFNFTKDNDPGGVTGLSSTEVVTLHVTFAQPSYTVSFNANGGRTPTPVSKTVTKGSPYGELATCTRVGYNFIGWYTASSGGTKIESTTTVSITSNQTLYAHWEQKPKIVVFFDPNGGNDPSFWYKECLAGVDVWSFPSVSYPDSSKSFIGWFTEPSGGTQKIAGQVIPEDQGNISLYAHWEDAGITITYNPNGGFVTPTEEKKMPGQAYGTLPVPVGLNPNDIFQGWFSEASGGTAITTTSIVPSTPTTLYAHWTRSGYSIIVTFDPGTGSTSTPTKSVESGKAIGVLPTATKTGNTFLGWYESTHSTEPITPAFIVPEYDITLYAGYSPQEITITFNADGGTSSESQRNIYYGSEIGTLPIATKTGLKLIGWFDESVSPARQISPTTTFTSSKILKAHWESASVIWIYGYKT